MAFTVGKLGDGEYERKNGDRSKAKDDGGYVYHVPMVGQTCISPGANNMDTLNKEEIYDDLVDDVEYQAQDDGGEAGALGPDFIAES